MKHILIYSFLVFIFAFRNTSSAQSIECNETALRTALVQGGTIELAENCHYLLSQNLPRITTDTIIRGHGAIIDGANQYRLLAVPGLADLAIDQVTLQNGVSGEGGAIYIRYGNLEIQESLLRDNQAIYGSGGAVWVNQGDVTVHNSRFSNNAAYLSGGAITLLTGDLVGEDNEFEGNRATRDGGAVVVGFGDVTASDTLFKQNTASLRGGALVVRRGNLALERSEIIQNHAESAGGGIYVYSDSYSEAVQVEINQSRLCENGSDLSGGAISIGEASSYSEDIRPGNGTIIISNSIFCQNSAATLGGTIYIRADSATFTSNTIINNIAGESASAIDFEAGTVEIEQNLIALNSPNDLPVDRQLISLGYNLIGNDGGGRLTITATDIINLDPMIDTDALLNPNSPALEAIPSEACKSTTDQREIPRPQGKGCDIGALEMEVGVLIATPTSAPMVGSQPQYIDCDEMSLSQALQLGGEVILPDTCVIVLTQALPLITSDLMLSVADEGAATLDGANQYQLLKLPGIQNLSVIDVTFQNSLGSAVWAARGDVMVRDSKFLDNHTTEYGAGIYAGNGNIIVESSVFQNNSALEGGALYAHNGQIEITNARFEANSADLNGGAVWLWEKDLRIEDSTFVNNKALEGDGGAIFTQQGAVTATNTQWIGNIAQGNGGSITALEGNVTASNSQFIANVASWGSGGGIFSENGTMTLSYSVIERNYSGIADSSVEVSAAIFTRAGDVQIVDSLFTENSNEWDSGFTVWAGGSAEVSRSAFTRNLVGGLFAGGGGSISNSTFGENQGVAISICCDALISHNTIVFNIIEGYADNGGAGIRAWDHVIISNNIIAGNVAVNAPDISISDYYSFEDIFTSRGYNIITYVMRNDLHSTDVINIDVSALHLGELTNNGYPLLEGSLALDAVPASACHIDEDQHYTTRPQNSRCDIGALEMNGANDLAVSQEDDSSAVVQHVSCSESELREALLRGGEIELEENCLYLLTADLPQLNYNIVVHGNGAVIDGAEQYTFFFAPAVTRISLENLTLRNGYSADYGGAVFSAKGEVTIINCTFSGNHARRAGGAIYAEGKITILYSTFSENSANERAGAIEITAGGDLTIGYSIVIGNQAETTPNMGSGLSYSHDGQIASLGYNIIDITNLNSTDLVLDSANLAQFDGKVYSLLETSPAIDAIPVELCTALVDQQNQARPQGEGCDIGAFETTLSRIVVATLSPTPEVSEAATELECNEAALQTAVEQGGIYTFPANCVITLTHDLPPLLNDITLYGNGAVLDGADEYHFLNVSESFDPVHIMLENLTIQHSQGGVAIYSGTITITDCQFYHNSTPPGSISGNGVITASRGDIQVLRSVFKNNGEQFGEYHESSAINLAFGGSVTVTESIFEENQDGAIRADGDVTIKNSVFWRNSTESENLLLGGAISMDGTSLRVEQSLFYENSASTSGGAIFVYGGEVTIINSTFYRNQVSDDYGRGGAIVLWSGNLTIQNSTIYGRSSGAKDNGSYQTNWENAVGVEVVFGSLWVQQSIIAAYPDGNISLHDGSFFSDGYNRFDALPSDFPLKPTDAIITFGTEHFDESEGRLTFEDTPEIVDVIPVDLCSVDEDQLGAARPYGTGCDIGAVEVINDH